MVQGRIAAIKNKLEEVIFPKTKTKAITNDLGVDLDTLLAQKIGGGSYGVPIYTKEHLDKLTNEDAIPQEYILIPSDTELNLPAGEGTNITYTSNKENATYLDIIFSTILKLQAEVAKLLNTFKYGINSYNGTNTAMSVIGQGYEDEKIIDNEPLWAVEETDLSLLNEMLLDSKHPLNARGTTNFDVSNAGILKITGSGYMNMPAEITESKFSKLFNYVISTGTGVKYTFKPQNSEDNLIVLDIAPLVPQVSGLFKILCVLSRDENSKHNFIWIQVSNRNTEEVLLEGYWNGSEIVEHKPDYLEIPYNFKEVEFTNLSLTKNNFYGKTYNFTNEVIPTTPGEEDYKYKVAHITIRSVSNLQMLNSIQQELLVNELIYNEKNGVLYINTANGIKSLATGSNNQEETDDNPGTDNPGENDPIIKPMSKAEFNEFLQQTGVSLHNNTIGDITFIHQDSNKTYKVGVNANGEITTTPVIKDTIKELMQTIPVSNLNKTIYTTRGFVSRYLLLKNGKITTDTEANIKSNAGINSDRVKIASFYAPLKSQKVYGCSHAYVELENTSDNDIPLDGFYLYHYYMEDKTLKLRKLALTGVLKNNSTYLIRGAKYSDATQANTFINVENYDQEWYENGQLVDLTIDDTEIESEKPNNYIGFVLAFTDEYTSDTNLTKYSLNSSTGEGLIYYHPLLVDLIQVGGAKFPGEGSKKYVNVGSTRKNCLVKNKFLLDPAKQAFKSLRYDIDNDKTTDGSKSGYKATYGSSDIEFVELSNPNIEFPYSDDIKQVSDYTPKASFENKNVCTDKTQIDLNKPNAVTVSFGINYKTRCFNWISAGEFDEYLFIKDGDDWIRFESYKSGATSETNGYWTKKEFSSEVLNAIYNRRINKLPGSGTIITSHKCIVSYSGSISGPYTIQYCVGRSLKDKTPDLEHSSKIMTFTLYPDSYKPVIFQTSDQQGFTWIEYQAWAAAAKVLNNKINEYLEANSYTIPILVNTGDMTQNGTRINEWLDYYKAGECLFDHLEQMNVVGNNDLCGNNPEVLGTGDDEGKSNSYYFHLFYCYDTDTSEGMPLPIVNGKYIPSLYYFDPSRSSRIVMINSEITIENCKTWFGAVNGGRTVNIYTGYQMKNSSSDTDDSCTYVTEINGKSFTPIYNWIYKVFNIEGKTIVPVCHEMPFTVITTANLADNLTNISRSIDKNATGNLCGSHLNQLGWQDVKSNYWFSRLLEHFGIKFMIGGHKHTYTVTYPIREYYTYTVGGETRNSLEHGKMTMPTSLNNDTFVSMVNGGKTPIMKSADYVEKAKITQNGFTDSGSNVPSTNQGTIIAGVREKISNQNYVVYSMLQATGYKLASNKELPSTYQFFTRIYARPYEKSGKASTLQQKPIYSVIEINTDSIKQNMYCVDGILDSSQKFTQQSHGKDQIQVKKLVYSENGIDETSGTTILATQHSDWIINLNDGSNIVTI